MSADVAPTKLGETDAAKRHPPTADHLRSDVAYLKLQQHRLRSKVHGEMAVLALRIEDNDRRAVQRRKVARLWVATGVVVLWLWFGCGALRELLDGAVLLPGFRLVFATLIAGVAVVLLTLHNAADEAEHRDRYHNWFRLTEPGPAADRDLA